MINFTQIILNEIPRTNPENVHPKRETNSILSQPFSGYFKYEPTHRQKSEMENGGLSMRQLRKRRENLSNGILQKMLFRKSLCK